MYQPLGSLTGIAFTYAFISKEWKSHGDDDGAGNCVPPGHHVRHGGSLGALSSSKHEVDVTLAKIEEIENHFIAWSSSVLAFGTVKRA